MAKAQDSACSEGNKETTCSSKMKSDPVFEQQPTEESSELTAMAPDTPAAKGLPLYVRWTFEGSVEEIELSPSATVADLMMASMAGQHASGVLSFQGAEMVDRDALLCDLGVCPETVVDFGPRTVVRVSILNMGYFTRASWWSQEMFDIPADDFDGFIAALRSKILEKVRIDSAGYDEERIPPEFLSSLEERHLELVPYDSTPLEGPPRSGKHTCLPLQSTWRLEIPALCDNWKLIGDMYRGCCIEVFFQVWKSADSM